MSEVRAEKLREFMEADRTNEQNRHQTQTSSLQVSIAHFFAKLQPLLDGYLDQDIDRETYTTKKAEIMSQKKSFEEKLAKLTLSQNLWLEPMKSG